MYLFTLESIIVGLSCLFTLSFLLTYLNNKKFHSKKCWIEEFSFNYIFTIIYCIMYILLFFISYKTIMLKYPLNFNCCLCWLLAICFLQGFDKSTERLVITEDGISLKTSFLGINKNCFVEWRSICSYTLYSDNYHVLKILYNNYDDEDYLTNEASFVISKKDIPKIQNTLNLFISSNNFSI
ncbi:hypothetical protein SAMN04488528_101466 [Clostridium frigidicarnis]|uniref:Uncharacterized protein n=1 Tax=Clostridium frigidicarnis TaxID=84698 RepID=A0A1I0YPU2_9CLOT|nr:hypothetical protein SAMN04488528_101466 [Clostridium frigidicarnis]